MNSIEIIGAVIVPGSQPEAAQIPAAVNYARYRSQQVLNTLESRSNLEPDTHSRLERIMSGLAVTAFKPKYK